MIRKELQQRIGDLADHAWELHRIANEHIYVEETETVAKVTEYCDRICSMAMEIKEAVGKDSAKVATLEKFSPVERSLNFGNEMHGTQPGFSYTDKLFDSLSISKLEQFPDPATGTILSSLRLEKIECSTDSGIIFNLKLTMSDGTESLLGFKNS